MKNFELAVKAKKTSLIAAIAFVAYNVILFAIAGFKGHNEIFWSSYGFTYAIFLSPMVCSLATRNRFHEPKDWIFGFPIFKHCFIYAIVELACAVAFMFLQNDISLVLAIAAQVVVLAIHLVFVILCFVVLDTIDGITKNVKESTQFMRELRVVVESLSNRVSDAALKAEITNLAKAIAASDPRSCKEIEDDEEKIVDQVKDIKRFIEKEENDRALECCKEAAILLKERNQKCMLYKK